MGNEIPVEEGREGRKRGRKGPKLPALKEAREEACADEDPADENEICICQRIVSDTISDGTEYVQSCGLCEENREGDVRLKGDRGDKRALKDMLKEAAEELG